jgi:hypothetical protein
MNEPMAVTANTAGRLGDDVPGTSPRPTARPSAFKYRLTDKGRDVYPILAAMAAWGERWLTGPEGTPLVLHHTACDHDMHAVVVCSEYDAPLHVREVRARRGPGFDPAAGPG